MGAVLTSALPRTTAAGIPSVNVREPQSIASEYETVVGVEVHAQLRTQSKLFCRCASTGGAPNTRTCPVCLGLPGALPVVNEEAVAMAVRVGLALECELQVRSRFARKHYFYPDLPKGYQITQFDAPICRRGRLVVNGRAIRIQRIHLEEDAGKNQHSHLRAASGAPLSLIDYNRAGVALIEIVSEPDLRSGEEAAEFLRELRATLMFIGVNDGNLEDGSFRCDVNVSVRRRGTNDMGVRCELKNINSFRFVTRAIDLESRKQIAARSRGEAIRPCTKQYNAELDDTIELREKGKSDDYRYVDEPDLPPLILTDSMIERARNALVELPARKRERYVHQLGIAPQDAATLCEHPALARYFERVLDGVGGDAKRVANFVVNEVKRDVRYDGLSASFATSESNVAALIAGMDRGALNLRLAKEVYRRMIAEQKTAREVMDAYGLSVLDDDAQIERVCRAVIEQHPKQVAAYRAGKKALLGFFVGMVMKATGGRAAPARVNATLERLLLGVQQPPL
jgi:aspartyl-tRNA(Asn)/glutamyl-tRNA(Gln) amidotransferase subunit B